MIVSPPFMPDVISTRFPSFSPVVTGWRCTLPFTTAYTKAPLSSRLKQGAGIVGAWYSRITLARPHMPGKNLPSGLGSSISVRSSWGTGGLFRRLAQGPEELELGSVMVDDRGQVLGAREGKGLNSLLGFD